MDKKEFQKLFEDALEKAAWNAEEKLGCILPRNFVIKLYGPGHSSGTLMSVVSAVDVLYIDDRLFYRVIDVAVIEVSKEKTVVFTRVSGHAPSTFEKTWNDPYGSGPFKQIIAKDINILSE